MPFTDDEKVRIRHHLGYLNVAGSQTFVLGTPAAVQTQFQIEGAMDKVLPAALPKARQLLQYLETIEAQMIGDLELLAIDAVDEITIRKTEQPELKREYQYHREGLANLLGIYPNPYDKRFYNTGSIRNISVTR